MFISLFFQKAFVPIDDVKTVYLILGDTPHLLQANKNIGFFGYFKFYISKTYNNNTENDFLQAKYRIKKEKS